jgi:hypothetical protein
MGQFDEGKGTHGKKEEIFPPPAPLPLYYALLSALILQMLKRLTPNRLEEQILTK